MLVSPPWLDKSGLCTRIRILEPPDTPIGIVIRKVTLTAPDHPR